MIKQLLLIAPLAVITACTTVSAVAPYGKDTYIIAAQDGGFGMVSPSQLHVMTAQKANNYCLKQDKEMVVSNTMKQQASAWNAASSDLIFRCVDQDDSENQRTRLVNDNK